MKTTDTRAQAALRRSLGWYRANRNLFTLDAGLSTHGIASAAALDKHTETLQGIIERIEQHAVTQETQGGQAGLKAQDEPRLCRELLTHQVRTIVQVARALDGTIPGIGILTMPKECRSSSVLLPFAAQFATQAAVYEQVLVEHGVPADFLEQLGTATAALQRSVDARGHARSRRKGATVGVAAEIALGRRVVSIMDAVLTRLLRSNAVALAEWKQAKRVTIKGNRGGGTPSETADAVGVAV